MRRLSLAITKWVCTLTISPLLLVWLVSFLLCPMWSPRGARLWIGNGAVGYQGGEAVSPPDFHLFRAGTFPFSGPAVWKPVVAKNALGTLVIVPIWIAAIPIAAASFAMWRMDIRRSRRIRSGLCLRCAYDRRGLAIDAACPECGSKP